MSHRLLEARVDGLGATTSAPPTLASIKVLVSNDDGYAAGRTDVLVDALRNVDGVAVTVVAPLEQQSGTGGKTWRPSAPASPPSTRSPPKQRELSVTRQ